MHAVAAHPAAAVGRGADRKPCHRFVGAPAGDLEQVLPELLLRVGLGQHILRRVVHAAQVAGMGRIATAPGARRRFEQQYAGAGLARHERGAQGGVAASDDQNIRLVRRALRWHHGDRTLHSRRSSASAS